MALKTPKVASSRLSLPLGVAGAEPDDAALGTLAYATDTDTVRVKTSTGWDDVGGGGGGTITEVDGTNGITATNPTGPIVTLEPVYGTSANTVMEGDQATGGDLSGAVVSPSVVAIHTGATQLTIGAISTGQVLVRSGTTIVGQTGSTPSGSAGGDLAGTYPNPEVTAVHTGATQLTIGAISTGQVLVRSGTTIVGQTGSAPTGSAGGDLAGTYPNPEVTAVHTGATQLTIGAISTGQLLVRSGTTLVGQTGAAPTGTAGGDLAGTYPNPSVAKLTTTTGPTSLTIGAIADGQALVRTGSTVVGSNLAQIVDRPGFPYLQKPTSPDSWNVEMRDQTNPDISAMGLGLSIHGRLTPWTVYTRAGAVDLSVNPSANTYRSSLIAGLLCLQLPASAQVTIYKSVNSSAFTYATRVWYQTISPSSGGFVDSFISDNTHLDAAGARTYYNGIEGNSMLEFLLVGPSTFTAFVSATAVPDGQWDLIRYLHNPAAANVMSTTMLSGRADAQVLQGISTTMRNADRTVTITPTIAGIWAGLGTSRGLIFIDFFRRFPLYTYLG